MTDKEGKYINVLDVETTVKCPIGKNKASPFWPDNWVVSVGSLARQENSDKSPIYCDVYAGYKKDSQFATPDIVTRMIGQNVKFDMHYMQKQNSGYDFKDLSIWDTQLAEYILTGQQHKFASLNELSKKYGGTQKPDIIKEMWDSGVQTEDIDEDTLMEYMEGDIRNTDLVALNQMQNVINKGILPFVETQMDAVKAIEEMEYNGLYIDYEKLNWLETHLKGSVESYRERIGHLLSRKQSVSLDIININSNDCLSALLFGGDIKYKEKEQIGYYKNKNPKYKIMEKTVRIRPLYIPREEWALKKAGYYSTADSVLTKLAENDPLHIIGSIQTYRKLKKELSTYIVGLKKLIFPDGCLHPNLNQSATDTGRLSSSNPNGQNLPSSDESRIKEMFVSRWHDDGAIIEADYKQLEVVCLAFLSQDKQLIADIINGIDIHIETGKKALRKSILTHDERRVVKSINFGLIYGGGATKLAKEAKVEKKVAQQCIDAFYDRYPGVAKWHQQTIEEVIKNRIYTGAMTKKGFPAGESHYRSVTGRTYVFKEDDPPPWAHWIKSPVFDPKEIKNYPVQGLATGDIVPMMLGVLFHVLKNDPHLKDNCLMVMTVHDSIVFDCKDEVLAYAMTTIKKTLEDAPKYLKSLLNIDFDLPLKVDISYGPNWKEQEKVDI